MKSRQLGVTLLELILVLALTGIATMLAFQEKQADLEQARARQVGSMLFQYNNAIREAMAKGVITATVTQNGADWLKSVNCGGQQPNGKEFLSCEFPSGTVVSPINFGRLALSTTIVVSGTAPDKKYKATTKTSAWTIMRPGGLSEIRADLAGVASLTAAAATASGFGAGASGGFSPLNVTTDSSFSSDPKTGVINIIASNTANNDVWLRTDGGNKMHASLGFDATDPTDRQILGVSRIQNLVGQVLRIGSGSPITPVTSSGVVIDASTELLGDLRARQNLVVDGGASVGGNFNSGGGITAAGSVKAQIFYDANNTSYYVDPDKTSNINALSTEGNISSKGNVTAAGSMSSQIYYDANNTAYYLDPSSSSRINTLAAQGNISAAGNVTASGVMSSQVYYDLNDSNYYVDPNGTSNVNAVNSNYLASNGRVKAAEYVEIGGLATAGNGCAPNGLLGRTPEGKVLSCESGSWKILGGTLDGPYRVSGSNLGHWAMCTLNYGSGNSKSLTYDGVNWIYSGSGTQVVYCYR